MSWLSIIQWFSRFAYNSHQREWCFFVDLFLFESDGGAMLAWRGFDRKSPLMCSSTASC